MGNMFGLSFNNKSDWCNTANKLQSFPPFLDTLALRSFKGQHCKVSLISVNDLVNQRTAVTIAKNVLL